jgi:hypothetical protein
MSKLPSDKSSTDVLQIELPAKPRKFPKPARSIALVEAVMASGREIL